MSVDINISNYEEYMYAFIDGELSPVELQAWNQFVLLHPEVRDELTLLEATKLDANMPGMEFGNKALLYKGKGIHAGNFHEYMLNYLDGELDDVNNQLFESFVNQNQGYAQELAAWKATKLTVASVAFPEKASLYKHRATKVVTWRWYAAAAVLAGLLLWRLPLWNDQPASPQVTVASNSAQNMPVNPKDDAPGKQLANDQLKLAETGAAKQLNDIKISEQAAEKTVIAASKATLVPKQSAKVTAVPRTSSQQQEQDAASLVDNVNKALAFDQELNTLQSADLALTKQPSIRNDVSIPGDLKVAPPKVQVATAVAKNKDPLEEKTFAAAAPRKEEFQGELIMSVSTSGEGKLFDKVTSVAKFFAKKKRD